MNFTWLARNSIALDINFLRLSPWPLAEKLNLIITKYALIIKHFFIPFVLGKSHVNFLGKDIFYDCRYGLAGFQSVMTRHQFLLQLANIKRVKTCVDVGANVGFFVFLLRDLYPRAQIYAFEPVPPTFSCLESNFRGDKKVSVNRLGLSDKPGSAKMEFESHLSATSSISPSGNLKIQLITLDNFVHAQKIAQIDILKIDVESFELHVLKGAKHALAKTRYLHLEVTIEDNSNYTFSDIFKYLSSPKYNFQLLSYRSYTDKSMSRATVFDLLLRNIHLK